MQWVRAHALLALVAVATILFLLESFAITNKSQKKTPAIAYPSWTEENIPVEQTFARNIATSKEEAGGAQGLTQAGVNSQVLSYSYVSPFSSNAPNPNPVFYYTKSSSSVQPASAQEVQTVGTGINSFFQDAYSLIPRGLINTSVTKKVRTPEEQVLYEYGNAVGMNVQVFESSHKSSEALKNFFPEKGGYASHNPAYINAVLALASDYSRLGDVIAKMDSVPETARALHLALAKNYSEIGSGLATIAKTNGDSEMTKAIVAYDASADAFIRNFVALAEFFSARGITFSASDPGNIFSFNNTGGL
ncbi:MAG: hypothetical protein Q7S75_02360 [bacterium]|nr:hypothetical protein [bacterium]